MKSMTSRSRLVTVVARERAAAAVTVVMAVTVGAAAAAGCLLPRSSLSSQSRGISLLFFL